MLVVWQQLKNIRLNAETSKHLWVYKLCKFNWFLFPCLYSSKLNKKHLKPYFIHSFIHFISTLFYWFHKFDQESQRIALHNNCKFMRGRWSLPNKGRMKIWENRKLFRKIYWVFTVLKFLHDRKMIDNLKAKFPTVPQTSSNNRRCNKIFCSLHQGATQ